MPKGPDGKNLPARKGLPGVSQGLSPEAIQAQLQQILASQAFTKAESLGSFLRYAVEQTLQGNQDQVKEYSIGAEVFDRGEAFDPRVDPIVRVQARKLRAKLDQYYSSDGSGDRILIAIPVGRYSATFKDRVIYPESTRAEARKRQPDLEAMEAETTLAVLSFANLSADPDNEYFTDGLSEELTTALAKVQGLKVVARTSAFQFKGKGESVSEIGRRLKADFVLEGSVRHSGNQVRVTAQLIQTLDGYHVWAESYDGDLEDVFAVQRKLTEAMIEKLKVKISSAQKRKLLRSHPQNMRAYNQYQMGWYFWHKGHDEVTLQSALGCFGLAIVEKRDYFAAHAARSMVLTALANFTVVNPREVWEKAMMSAQKALEGDDRLAEAWIALGMIRSLFDWEWKAAEQDFKQAIRVSPNSALAHHTYAVCCLGPQGRLDEAIAEMEKAQELDPLSFLLKVDTGSVLIWMRRYDEALEQQRIALEMEPFSPRLHWEMIVTLGLMGRVEDAIKVLRKMILFAGNIPFRYLAEATLLILTGKRTEAYRTLREMEKMSDDRYLSPLHRCWILLALREFDQAFEELEMAFEKRDPWIRLMKVQPFYDPVRSDPRFLDMLRRLRLDD